MLRPPRGGANHAVDATFALGTQREGEGRELKRLGDVQAAHAKFAGAERCYRVAADAGHVLAKCRLGRMIEQGWGRDKPDPAAAAALYREAADEGCAEGENNLGALLYLGIAGSVDAGHDAGALATPKATPRRLRRCSPREVAGPPRRAAPRAVLRGRQGGSRGRDLERAGALYLRRRVWGGGRVRGRRQRRDDAGRPAGRVSVRAGAAGGGTRRRLRRWR